MKLSTLGLIISLSSSCLFFDSSDISETDADISDVQDANSKDLRTDGNCDGKVIDFDIVADGNDYLIVESCEEHVVLKRIVVEGVERVQYVWSYGSKKVSLSSDVNQLLVGLEDTVFSCPDDCTEDEKFTGAKEVLVGVQGDERAYLVRYAKEINFFHIKGATRKGQVDPRLGEFSNLQLIASPNANRARFLATAYKDGWVYGFLENGKERHCVADKHDRGLRVDEIAFLKKITLVFTTEEGRLATKDLRENDCGSREVQEDSDDKENVESFDFYRLSQGIFAGAIRQNETISVLKFIERDKKVGIPDIINISETSTFEIAGTETTYLLGVLTDGTIKYHNGTF